MSRCSSDSMVAGPGPLLGTAEATKMAVVTMDKGEGSGEHWGLCEASLAIYTWSSTPVASVPVLAL